MISERFVDGLYELVLEKSVVLGLFIHHYSKFRIQIIPSLSFKTKTSSLKSYYFTPGNVIIIELWETKSLSLNLGEIIGGGHFPPPTLKKSVLLPANEEITTPSIKVYKYLLHLLHPDNIVPSNMTLLVTRKSQ